MESDFHCLIGYWNVSINFKEMMFRAGKFCLEWIPSVLRKELVSGKFCSNPTHKGLLHSLK